MGAGMGSGLVDGGRFYREETVHQTLQRVLDAPGPSHSSGWRKASHLGGGTGLEGPHSVA